MVAPEEAERAPGLAVAHDGSPQIYQGAAAVDEGVHRLLGVDAPVQDAREAPDGHVVAVTQAAGFQGLLLGALQV